VYGAGLQLRHKRLLSLAEKQTDPLRARRYECAFEEVGCPELIEDCEGLQRAGVLWQPVRFSARYPVRLSLFAGVLLLLIAVVAWLSERAFVRTAQRAIGSVVTLNERNGIPDVQFSVPAGQTYIFSDTGIRHHVIVGERVTVLYDLDSPQLTAEIESSWLTWQIPVPLLIMSGVCFFGAFLWRNTTRR
jgi:hypothetical protein